jgi:hypothetical protein
MAIKIAPPLDLSRGFELARDFAAPMPEPVGRGFASSGLSLGLFARFSKLDDVTHDLLAGRLYRAPVRFAL